jgi:hypothetical protein
VKVASAAFYLRLMVRFSELGLFLFLKVSEGVKIADPIVPVIL